MLGRGDQLITSAMTVGEILVKPRERQDLDLCKEYERAITATALVLPFDLHAARRFSELRLNRTLRAPDAIQLSCAATVDTDLFVTNDSRLSGIRIDGVQFIVSLDRIPF
jgi:predicted nucleic acid-binding protein